MDDNKILGWIIDAQKKILVFLGFAFMLLLLYSVALAGFGVDPTPTINAFLPIITGWMGIAIGFFFSREFSNVIERKVSQHKLHQLDLIEELNKVRNRLAKKKELVDRLQRIISEQYRIIDDLRQYYSRKEKLCKEKQRKTKDIYT